MLVRPNRSVPVTNDRFSLSFAHSKICRLRVRVLDPLQWFRLDPGAS